MSRSCVRLFGRVLIWLCVRVQPNQTHVVLLQVHPTLRAHHWLELQFRSVEPPGRCSRGGNAGSTDNPGRETSVRRWSDMTHAQLSPATYLGSFVCTFCTKSLEINANCWYLVVPLTQKATCRRAMPPLQLFPSKFPIVLSSCSRPARRMHARSARLWLQRRALGFKSLSSRPRSVPPHLVLDVGVRFARVESSCTGYSCTG